MIEKRPMKAWNGGSIERAMELAGERRKKLVAQGALICCACDGEGGDTVAKTICEGCFGAGVILPPGGLTLPAAKPALPPCFRCPKLDHDAMRTAHAGWAPRATCCEGKCEKCGADLVSIDGFWRAFQEPHCPPCLLSTPTPA